MNKFTNILIVVTMGLLSYGITAYIKNSAPPQMSETPDTPAILAPVIDDDEFEKIPEFSFTALSGQEYKISDFKGKIVVLNFWASWCAPCIKEFPLLLETASKNKDDVVLIALSSDVKRESITGFLEKQLRAKGLNWKHDNVIIAHDTNNVTQEVFQTHRLPETIIIDGSQNMRSKLVGANWELQDLQSLVDKISKK